MTPLEERAEQAFIGHCRPGDIAPLPCWAGQGSAFMHTGSWPCKNAPVEPLGLCVEHRIEILGRAD